MSGEGWRTLLVRDEEECVPCWSETKKKSGYPAGQRQRRVRTLPIRDEEECVPCWSETKKESGHPAGQRQKRVRTLLVRDKEECIPCWLETKKSAWAHIEQHSFCECADCVQSGSGRRLKRLLMAPGLRGGS